MTYNQKKPPDRTHYLSRGLQPTLGRMMVEIQRRRVPVRVLGVRTRGWRARPVFVAGCK